MKPWITDEMKRVINQKHFLFRRYKRGIITFEVYNNHKNLCSRMLRNCKADYFNYKFESCRGNIRNTRKKVFN